MQFIWSQWIYRSCLHRPVVRAVRRKEWGGFRLGVRAYATTPEEIANFDPETQDKKWRIDGIAKLFRDSYPRLSVNPQSVTCEEFRKKYDRVSPKETVDEPVVIYGRVQASRTGGSKLLFFDVLNEGVRVQILCNQQLLADAGISPEKFRDFYHVLRRGDSYAITGKPHRTSRGELSVLATELPKLMSPCLHNIPVHRRDLETSPYDRHVELLSSPTAADVLRARSAIIQCTRNFFLERAFMEVDTPIIAAAAGGAIARPFETYATEFTDQKLALRIAPELWLKRLVVSGFDKVFELGASFRNEGLDKTHNPEFTTCESYQAFADLETLMSMTEALLCGLSAHLNTLTLNLPNPPPPFTSPFRRLDFIPALESALQQPLTHLDSPTTLPTLTDLFHSRSIPLPDQLTIPRLLDKLAAHYLEPLCTTPTFIINHPAALAPLAKSFLHPARPEQMVSARAELFVGGRELANMYEEENSPDAQRHKLLAQLETPERGDGGGDGSNGSGTLDEQYLGVLEWGLPPTGGWGCGMERMVMALTGARRIADVLPFGNLRNVVRMGSR